MATLAGAGVYSEIYSFGVVLLEILTGMNVCNWNREEGKQNLVKWATPLLAHEANLGRILDPQLLDDNNNQPPKGAFMLAQVVSKCLQPTQDKRPSMEEILEVLRACYSVSVCV
ncbi:putative serine/threonine-protein kinase PIX13 [Bidens hawaiensis]|uniref:putative serine/threonine-protein kinase PIX13 n=1 Tax=Bidens hawaiensis TaxID=980011 RepID=UPI0040495F61